MTAATVSFEDFRGKFVFNPHLAGHISAERECYITTREGTIVPRAKQVLNAMKACYPQLANFFSYELSNCQVEFKSGPCRNTAELIVKLAELETALDNVLHAWGLSKRWLEVAPKNMPLYVYPDPTGRYQTIVKNMPKATLQAACRITGTHFHYGMPDAATALRVYNYMIRHTARLTRLGDNSNGERLALYRVVAPNCDPLRYDSWRDFYNQALQHGFAENPRDCWHMIRLTIYGTVEIRMFGVPTSLSELETWAIRGQELCLCT